LSHETTEEKEMGDMLKSLEAESRSL